MRTLLIALALLSASAHGAEAIKPDSDRTDVRIVVQWGSQARTIEKCTELGAWNGVAPTRAKRPVGCNAYSHDTNVCYIYVSKPKDVDDDKTTTLGHEVAHCLLGKYHVQEEL